jgi:DUF4097 and DUF4098 domain-containing protein YvlB
MSIETLERKFTLTGTASLSLANVRGSVNIQPGEDGEITIIASKRTNTGNAENTRIELSQTEAGEVEVATRYDQGGFGFFRKNHLCKVDYDIRVPETCALKVRGVSNSTSIEGVNGRKDISSVSGDIDLRNLNGEIKVKNVSGDIDGKKVSGSAHLEVVSGDIKFLQADFPTLRGKSVSGDIEIESPLGDGPYDFNTVSGDIRFIIPKLRGATIHSHTLSGKVSTSAPISNLEQNRNNHRIVLDDGGVKISHKSISGDFILLNKSDNGSAPESSASSGDVVHPESRSEILDRVAQGDLSVDEALQLFSANNPD